MENMELYNKYRSVPNNALKSFDNGKFKGTDIDTMWRIKCLTETFGPCGIGWTYSIVDHWTETVGDNVLVFVEGRISLFIDDEWTKPICGTGGNKLAYMSNSGKLIVSDEAYKMASTDAFGVCCKMLGIGADVYWGNDKTKYSEQSKINLSNEMVDKLKECGIVDYEKLRRYYKVDILTDIEGQKAIDLWREQNG